MVGLVQPDQNALLGLAAQAGDDHLVQQGVNRAKILGGRIQHDKHHVNDLCTLGVRLAQFGLDSLGDGDVVLHAVAQTWGVPDAEVVQRIAVDGRRFGVHSRADLGDLRVKQGVDGGAFAASGGTHHQQVELFVRQVQQLFRAGGGAGTVLVLQVQQVQQVQQILKAGGSLFTHGFFLRFVVQCSRR